MAKLISVPDKADPSPLFLKLMFEALHRLTIVGNMLREHGPTGAVVAKADMESLSAELPAIMQVIFGESPSQVGLKSLVDRRNALSKEQFGAEDYTTLPKEKQVKNAQEMLSRRNREVKDALLKYLDGVEPEIAVWLRDLEKATSNATKSAQDGEPSSEGPGLTAPPRG